MPSFEDIFSHKRQERKSKMGEKDMKKKKEVKKGKTR